MLSLTGHRPTRYSIYSGDPDGFFRIDASTGLIRTASNLDHETRANVLLNIQATSGNPPAYGHTQVRNILLFFFAFIIISNNQSKFLLYFF